MKREGGRKDRARTVGFGDAPALDAVPRVDSTPPTAQEAPAAAGGSGPSRSGTVKDFRALFDTAAKKEKEDKEKEKEKETRSSGLKLFHFRVGAEKKSSPQPSPTAHRDATGSVSPAPGQGEERKWKQKLELHKAEHTKKGGVSPSPSGNIAPLSPRQMHYNGMPPSVPPNNGERRPSGQGRNLNISPAASGSASPTPTPTPGGHLSPQQQAARAEEFKVTQLICAFEAAFIKNPRADLSVLEQAEWDDLFRAQTMKKKAPKEKASVFGLFGGGGGKAAADDDDEKDAKDGSPVSNKELDQMMMAKHKETWDSLDAAKKKRRLQEFLKKRTGVREMLEEDLRLHAGLASPVDDTQDYPALAAELPPPMLRVPCPGHRLELGMFPTTIESQLKYLSLEDAEKGDAYYRDFFHGKDHHNYIAADPQGYHVIVSVQTGDDHKERANARVMVRTKDGAYCTFVSADPDSKTMIKSLCDATESLNAYTNWKRIKDTDKSLEKSLLGLEKQMLMKRSKFGVIYVKPGQSNENDIYSNSQADMSEAFAEFLEWAGTKVALQGWSDFSGGLDVRNNSTGTHSYYTRHRGIEIMMHVAPFLPHFAHDVQHLEKKRHIGNDIAALVFLDDTEQPFDPNAFVSEFLHIFAFVSVDRAKTQETGQVHYRLAFASREVDLVMPIIPYPGSFPRTPELRDFLLTKLLNAERGALHAPVFEAKMVRTRKQLLGDLANDVGYKQ